MSNANFKKRLDKGKILSDELCEYLQANEIEYLLSGYEHLKGTGNAHDVLKKCYDKTSRFMRYYPDLFVILTRKSCLIEIKNSSGIENECYQAYLHLNNSQAVNIMLFLKNRKLCMIEDLKLQPSKSFDPIAQMNIPVVDGIWRTPRAMDKETYKKYKQAYASAKKYTSGCSFAFIDFKNTRFWDLDVIPRLNKSVTSQKNS